MVTRANRFGSKLNEVMAQEESFTSPYMKDIAMEESNLNSSVFVGGFMQCAVLSGSKLRDATFNQVVFTGSALEEADFERANLSYPVFNSARLDQASLRQAQLQGSRFANVILLDKDFSYARNIPEYLSQMLKRNKVRH